MLLLEKHRIRIINQRYLAIGVKAEMPFSIFAKSKILSSLAKFRSRENFRENNFANTAKKRAFDPASHIFSEKFSENKYLCKFFTENK
jgi:hypothetical protein